MPQLIMLALLGLLFYLYWQRGPALGNAKHDLRIRHGLLVIERGHLSPDDRHRIEEIIRDGKIVRGKITVSQQGRVELSRDIPTQYHQLLRNILVNSQ